MPETPKILGQSAPAATTLTDLYTVPASTNTIVSSIVVANRGTTSTTFRISIAPSGAADANSQYIYFDIPIPANDSFVATIGVALAATDKIRVFAGNANLSFSAYGIEIT